MSAYSRNREHPRLLTRTHDFFVATSDFTILATSHILGVVLVALSLGSELSSSRKDIKT